jgi:hypothetical protein
MSSASSRGARAAFRSFVRVLGIAVVAVGLKWRLVVVEFRTTRDVAIVWWPNNSSHNCVLNDALRWHVTWSRGVMSSHFLLQKEMAV